MNNAHREQKPVCSDLLTSELAFLSGGGELGALVRAFDWSDTALGPVAAWPQALKTTVGIVLRSPAAMVVLWGEEGVMIYNDAYSAFARARHPMQLGMEVRQSWPEAADFNDNVMKVVMAGGTLSYKDQELELNRDGTPRPVWLNLDYSPVVDENGKPLGVMAVVVETTERVLTERRSQAEKQRLQQLFAQAPGFMAMLTGDEHVFELVNPAYEQLVGHRDVQGKAVREALPEVVGQGFLELLDQVYQTGTAFTGSAVKVGLQRTPGSAVEERYVDFVYQPIVGEAGKVTGIFVEGYDVTERVQGEERLRLLMGELNHRLKNTLAKIQAIIMQTLRGAGSLEEAHDTLSARIIALSRAQDVLTDSNLQGADLVEVVRATVEPHGADITRFHSDGPPVHLGPRAALAMSLALHELATNAAKYGALSTAEGRVEIVWSVEQTPEPTLRLEWTEQDGPAVVAPSRKGFGTQLIERGLALELGAEVTLDYAPAGFAFRLSTTLASLEDKDVSDRERN